MGRRRRRGGANRISEEQNMQITKEDVRSVSAHPVFDLVPEAFHYPTSTTLLGLLVI